MNAESWIKILQEHYPIDIPYCQQGECFVKSKKDRSRPIETGPRLKRSAWNVHKFGGSSFEKAESYSFVASLINKFDGKNLIVVSALNGMTNQLYSICKRAKQPDWLQSDEWLQMIVRISQTIKNKLGTSLSGEKEIRRFAADLLYLSSVLSRMSTASEPDQQAIEQLVVGYGEIWSARLMTQTLRDDYHRATAFLDARDVLVVNQDADLHIDVQWEVTKEKLKRWFYNCRYCDVLVVTGFIARNLEGLPVTLKRNGSDFTATIFSVLTKANSVTIWKDVDGMYTADPKKHPDARFIPYQTFAEAEEASRHGAFVIQADCIAPARMFNIPIYLRNCFKLECPGTRIGSSILPQLPPEPASPTDVASHPAAGCGTCDPVLECNNQSIDCLGVGECRKEAVDPLMLSEGPPRDHLLESIETFPEANGGETGGVDHCVYEGDVLTATSAAAVVVVGAATTVEVDVVAVEPMEKVYPHCSDTDVTYSDEHTVREIIV